MTDYRLAMRLLIEGKSYREINRRTALAQATISKAKKALTAAGIATVDELGKVSDEEIAELLGDKRLAIPQRYVPIDMDKVAAARTGKKKTRLNVLWALYTAEPAPSGLRHYSYERFRQLVAGQAASRGLSARMVYTPGQTMQTDWAGSRMVLVDAVTGKKKKVSIFVASLPYSGMIFATARNDEQQDNWHTAHRLAFEYFGGTCEVIVPDNASTATNQAEKGDRQRSINSSFAEFLEYYNTAAYAAEPRKPRHKGHVESGVNVVTTSIIQKLAGRSFHLLDDLNEAIATEVDAVNDRTPFRDQQVSRREIFTSSEASYLTKLPDRPWVKTTWRKSKVAPNSHIRVDSVNYSAPYQLLGKTVDVRIRGQVLDIFHDDKHVASHAISTQRGRYVTDKSHFPVGMDVPNSVWSADYFRTQARKVGPSTLAVIESLIASRLIVAQAYQPARAILNLGKDVENKPLLEQACLRLTSGDSPRAVSYSAVKTMMAAIRAEGTTARDTQVPPLDAHRRPALQSLALPNRDDARGLVGDPNQFALDNLLHSSTTTPDPHHDQDMGHNQDQHLIQGQGQGQDQGQDVERQEQ